MRMSIEYCDDQDFTKPVWITDLTNFNRMPEPWVECSADEYYHMRSIYMPQFIEYRYITHDKIGTIHIEWFHSKAFAIRWPVKWHCEDSGIVYDEQPRFFRIGCKHTYYTMSIDECLKEGRIHYGGCYQVMRCIKCGFTEAYDSGD